MASRVALLGRQRGLAARGAHQAAQALGIAIGMLVQPAGQRLVVGQQRIAPAFGLVQQQRVAGRAQLGFGHGFAQRLGVDLAHQLAHVLQLAAPAFVRACLAVLQQRIEQALGQLQRCQPRIGQIGQCHAQLLQLVRLMLQPCLAGRFDAVRSVFGQRVVGAGEAGHGARRIQQVRSVS